MVKSIGKFLVSIFAKAIGKSKRSFDYMLTFPLKSQTEEFFEKLHVLGDIHINKTVKLASKFVKPEDVILDIGGFVGMTAELFAKRFPNNKVYVFEPLPGNIEKIKLIAKKFSNITIVPKAVGEENGKTVINMSANMASSSIFPLVADPKSEAFYKPLGSAGSLEIDVIALDEFLPDDITIGIMKMDVQGYELKALEGAKRILKNTNFITLEVANHDYYKGGVKYYEIDQFMRNHDFVLGDLFPSLKDNGLLKEWDCIYVNKRIYDNW